MASKNTKNFTNDQRNKINGKRRRSNTYRHDKDNFSKGKDDKVMDPKPGGNDPRWWGSKDYVNAVASFNFASPLGMRVPYSFRNDPNSNITYRMSATQSLPTVPGVMAIDVLPTVGIAKSAPDPVNTYIRSVFTKLRSTNNQNAPYQAPDLGMYILAIDSVHMLIEQLVRMYGVARTYSAMNRYLPNAVLQAMGINPQDPAYNLYSHLADFRAEVLDLMVKIQTLLIPKGISLNERHRELVKYIYKDGNTAKSQIYLFRTPYLYKYNELYNTSGGGLEALATPIGQGADKWVSMAHQLIDQLTTSQFFAIVSGDILKSFGYEKLYSMPFFDELYTVVPVNNPEILLEIHNLKVCGDRFDSTAFDITQDASTNSLLAAPYTTTGALASAGSVCPIIDIPVDNPDPDLVMVATRLTVVGATGYDTTAAKYKFTPDMIGTELVTKINIYAYDANGSIVVYSTDTNCINNITQFYGWYMAESFFDWHPHVYYLRTSSNNTTAELCSVISELQNYTVMESGDLYKLHQMAVYGALTAVDVDNTGLK